MKSAQIRNLGRRGFDEVWALQKTLVEERQRDEIPDTLILVEHDDVITLGRRLGSAQHIHTSDIPVVEIERGGDVTWHGPGQLVGYPILKLDGDERDLHAYLRHLEEALIRASKRLGVDAGRKDGFTGVWLDGGARKVASIGIAVRRWVTMHGFALNVDVDLARFAAIDPCGLPASVMTSLAEALGRRVSLAEVTPLVAEELSIVFDRQFA